MVFFRPWLQIATEPSNLFHRSFVTVCILSYFSFFSFFTEEVEDTTRTERIFINFSSIRITLWTSLLFYNKTESVIFVYLLCFCFQRNHICRIYLPTVFLFFHNSQMPVKMCKRICFPPVVFLLILLSTIYCIV